MRYPAQTMHTSLFSNRFAPADLHAVTFTVNYALELDNKLFSVFALEIPKHVLAKVVGAMHITFRRGVCAVRVDRLGKIPVSDYLELAARRCQFDCGPERAMGAWNRRHLLR